MFKISPYKLSEISLLAFALSIPLTRLVGGLNLIAFFFVFLFISIKIKSKYKLPPSLAWLCAVALIYVGLSLAGILPSIWTRYFEVSAVPQQALFAYAIPTTFLVMCYYLSRCLASEIKRKELALKLLIVWATVKLLGFMLPASEDRDLLDAISISGMGSVTSLIIVSTALYLSVIKKPLNRLAVLTAFATLSFLSPFSQNKIFAILLFLIWIIPKHSLKICAALIISSIAVYLYAYAQPFSVHGIDENLTVRIILLKDAVSGFVNSNFIGVGFGTEAITNYYTVFGNPVFHDEEELGFIHLAHHNSFATIAFRLGILGFLLFSFFTYQTLREASVDGAHNERAVKSSVFLAFFVVTFLNPALESFVYLYGVCFYLSLIWAFSQQRITEEQNRLKTTCKDKKSRPLAPPSLKSISTDS